MKKLFGCVRVCLLLLPVLLVLCTITGVKANNIRVEGKTRVTGFSGDTAIIEVNLRWDNSWRDDFNWDAAWVFFKYKKRGLENPWQHVYLSSSGHVLNPSAGNEGGGYAYMVGANGGKVNGLYVMRNGISEGNVSVRLQAKWCLSGTGLTKSDFGDALNGIYVAVHAIEMVYIPYGAYYLGDGYSYGSLQNKVQGAPLPSAYDIIDNTSGYEYNIKNPVVTGPVENIADRNPAAAYPNSTLYFNAVGGGWVQIDFKTPKTIRYFGVSAASNYCSGSQDCRPKGNWYLTGSNDSLTWTRLYTGVNTDWWGTSVAYPVQNTLKVTNPGSYRYYRIEMSGAVRTDDGIVIQSIAMTEKDLETCMVDSEDALTLASSHTSWSGTLAASYPKGYAGFYVMKYETSQEQYVEFLNSLTLEQQKARVTNNNFSTMKRGDYVFGDLHTPSCRNGIVFVEQRQPNTPVVFGNNLNPNNDLFSSDDGQTLACNYISVEDMIAYCSWSGLRPMSELEYEKACHRFYPQVPDKGEYAWNTNNGVNRLSTLSDLNYRGDEREQAVSYLKNVNSGTTNSINGPVRCGLFATSATNQTQAGATYWGVMEMSGNLKELCVSVGNPNYNGASCGTGVYNAAYWNTAVGSYGVRGGGYNSPDSLLRTSDRSEAMNYFISITQRDSTVGFRGVYSLSGIKIDGGEIQGDTICTDSEKSILNVLAASCPDFPDLRFQYNWYVKKPGEAKFELIENASGKTLIYTEFENAGTTFVTYQFKRVGICAMGMAETQTNVIVAPLPWAVDLDTYTNVYPSFTVTSTWTNMPQAYWKLENAPTGISIAAHAGVVSGLTANSVFGADVTVSSDKCPGIDYKKRIIVRRDFSAVGTGSIQLEPGEYVMECWGAQGGRSRANWAWAAYGGNGAYTRGEITLTNATMFYTYTGGKGNDAGTNGMCGRPVGGWNGGGSGGQDGNCDSQPEPGGAGGGASDIRLIGGAWNDATSLRSRIMVAGGGGGGSWTSTGGAGGTLSVSGGGSQTGSYWGYGGAAANNSKNTNGPGGGGSGYYGGIGGTGEYRAGTGGSSFISGHPGCNAIDASGSHTGQPVHYSGLQFYNTSMQAGARAGNGYVRISPVH